MATNTELKVQEAQVPGPTELESDNFGMWLFLATELLFFGALLMCYLVYRSLYPDAFAVGTGLMNVALGTTNTVVLLTSSFTFACAVHFAKKPGAWKTVNLLVGITFLLACCFLVIKGFEYHHEITHGYFPGKGFHLGPEKAVGVDPRNVHLFFVIYFTITGLHAFHVICGMIAMIWLMTVVRRNRQSHAKYISAVDNTGLYWHFVDIVWVFVFPLLYLMETKNV